MREQTSFGGWDFNVIWSIDESSSYPWLRTNEQLPHPGVKTSAANNLPSKPQLIYPANGQRGLGSTVTFKWKPSTDPDGDSVTYDVYYCLHADPINNCSPRPVAALNRETGIYHAGIGYGGFGLILAGMILGIGNRRIMIILLAGLALAGMFMVSCGNKESTDQGLSTYTATDIKAAKTYYWAIVAKDDKGGTIASDVWSFSSE